MWSILDINSAFKQDAFLTEAHEIGDFSKSFFKVNTKNFIHSLLNVFTSDKFNISLAVNFEMVPSTSKPILTVFNGRIFFLLSKSMTQIVLLFSMASAFTINESNSCKSF